MNQKSTGYRILHFFLIKLLIGTLVVVGIVVAGQLASHVLLGLTPLGRDLKNLCSGLLTALLALSSYSLLFKFYEKRRISELSANGIAKHIGTGALLGFVLQSLTILVIYFSHSYSVLSVNPIWFLIPPLTMAISSAIFEEILLRGIIFRILEEKLGSYIALVISALLFGALHLANPNSSLLLALGLAIQAGLLLAVAYMYSRSLWFPIAIHFAWNFTQSGIFGASVSGNTVSKSLVTSKIEGPEWITGGAFGPEGSVQATIFCLLAMLALLVMSHRQNKIVPPSWRNKARSLQTGEVNPIKP